jgi:hypothetical protein
MDSINNDFSFMKAGDSFAEPYSTFQFISDVPEYTFGANKALEDILWQLDIYAVSGSTAIDVAEKAMNCFDECSLSVSGYSHLRNKRENNDLIYESDTDIYHYFIEYKVLIEEN